MNCRFVQKITEDRVHKQYLQPLEDNVYFLVGKGLHVTRQFGQWRNEKALNDCQYLFPNLEHHRVLDSVRQVGIENMQIGVKVVE